ncbi:MAG: isochorismatase family protein [Proteobacteria bacterium]|nr:isochorismatase family protein [Pseudomonadota bacterium]MBI3498402.1 isochorismatase family protein [Pseudomonadota bacterium]
MDGERAPKFGSKDLRMPDALRGPLLAHLADLRRAYERRDWAGRVGFGTRPAVIVIDLAQYWVDPKQTIGSNLEVVVEAAATVVRAARAAGAPVFFTTYARDRAHPPSPHDKKQSIKLPVEEKHLWEIDPRLERRPTEKLILKRYASAFKGTNLLDMLTMLRVDTLIVTGVSTSHCVYATCREATDCFHVIVPREAVGERCELMHEVFLHDIDVDLGDVMPLVDVVGYLGTVKPAAA